MREIDSSLRRVIRAASVLWAVLAGLVVAVLAQEPTEPDRLSELAKAHPDRMGRVYLFVQKRYPDLSKEVKAHIDKEYPDFWKFAEGVMRELQKQKKYAELPRFVQAEILGIIELNAPNFQRDIRELIDTKYPILWQRIEELRAANPKATPDELIPKLVAEYPNLLPDILKAVQKRWPHLLADVTQRVAEEFPGLMEDLMTAVTKKTRNCR
ncbi:MAG: hypothetical protein ACE5O2_04505, partial [Armatimonadota bacterium]